MSWDDHSTPFSDQVLSPDSAEQVLTPPGELTSVLKSSPVQSFDPFWVQPQPVQS